MRPCYEQNGGGRLAHDIDPRIQRIDGDLGDLIMDSSAKS